MDWTEFKKKAKNLGAVVPSNRDSALIVVYYYRDGVEWRFYQSGLILMHFAAGCARTDIEIIGGKTPDEMYQFLQLIKVDVVGL